MDALKSTFTTELYKISKRKDSWIFFSILFVPILYAIGLASNSSVITYSGSGNLTALGFATAMFQTSQSMFIFNVILVAIVGKSMATEIENKSLLLYINRVGDRKAIYVGKELALFTFTFLVEVLLFIISIVSYYLLLCRNENIANGNFFDTAALSELAQIVSISAFWFITIFFVLALATKLKTIACVGLYMILYIAMNLISYVARIKYLSPLFYVSAFAADDKIHSLNIVLFILYFFIIVVVTNFVGTRKLSRMDL